MYSTRRTNIKKILFQIYFYMPPMNTTSSNGSKIFPLMIPAESFEHPSVAYIDLVRILITFFVVTSRLNY